jgi:hypothetical protein
MKLENLVEVKDSALNEHIEYPDIDELENALVNPDAVNSLKQIFKNVTNTFKFIKSESYPSSSATKTVLAFYNGIITMRISYNINHDNKSLEYIISSCVFDRHLVISTHGKQREDDANHTLTRFDRFKLKDKSDFDFVEKQIDRQIEISETFVDWYFELSGKFGKLKLIKTSENLNSSQSSTDSFFTAVGGQFGLRNYDEFDPLPSDAKVINKVF